MRETMRTIIRASAVVFPVALCSAAGAATSLDFGSVEFVGTADSALPVYAYNAVDSMIDEAGEHNAARLASFRSGVAGFTGGTSITDAGASAFIDLFAAGSYTDQSTGTVDAVYTTSFSLTETTDVTLEFDSTWILGGGAGGPGYSTLVYSFGEALSGSFDTRGESDNQGTFSRTQSVTLDAGTYEFSLVSDVYAPDQTSRLQLNFDLSFASASVPSPGAAALALLAGIAGCATRRR